MQILVVDDDDAYREALCAYLESEGYRTLQARDGFEALAVARAHRPGAIVLDLMLPEVDGVELMARLDIEPDLRSIPRFVLSSFVYDVGQVRGVPAFPKREDVEALLYAVRVAEVTTTRHVH